jgi:hypothetical protein
METPIFYQVKGTLLRSRGNETNPVEICQVFIDEKPIIARRKAFDFFQNYFDVFLQSIGKSSTDFEETQQLLVDFYKSHKEQNFFGIPDLKIDNDAFYGIRINCILSDSKQHTTKEGEVIYEDSDIIHFFGSDYEEMRKLLLPNLMTEYELYLEFGLEIDNLGNSIDLIGNGLEEDSVTILESPIDFSKSKK